MTIADVWLAGIKRPNLIKDEVHIWRAPLQIDSSVLQQLSSNLSSDEIARANRFHFSKDRESFVAARSILRDLLSRYTGVPGCKMEFEYSTEGKPALVAADEQRTLRFNLSHSNGWAAFVFSSERQVGVDIERVRPDVAADEIAERYFSQTEIAELRALSSEKRAEGFFLCWTRKEAYVKATGRGLQVSLSSFDVSLTPGKPAELRSEDAFRWELHSFTPAENFVGALIVEGKQLTLRYFDWLP